MVDALSAVASAAKWISTSLIQEGKYLFGVEDHVRELEKDLKYIQSLLQDVDKDPHLTRQDSQLRNFAEDIRELAFRAEDAIDTYVVDVGAKVYRRDLFLRIACLASHFYPVHMLIKEIEAIQQEIQKANKRFKNFKNLLKSSGNIGSVSSSQPSRTENYIHLDDEVVVGIDGDITRLADRLIDPEDDFKVLGIVGTGGAGKTTLATQLYHDSKVRSRFPHKAFVFISREWNIIEVLQRIFKDVMEFEEGDVIPSCKRELGEQLRNFLMDKDYLVVLDDVWDTKAWDDISPVLPRSNNGCRVIITTQKEDVPCYADSNCIIHRPVLLTEDQKWELFSKVAMKGRVGIEDNDAFENLASQMLEKCQGLPLAVVILAGVLRTKQEWYQWEDISKEYAECILKGHGTPNHGPVTDMLELSYIDLPTYLKPCLLYFAIFLEDWAFPADTLIEMWIAEGFVTNDHQKGQETLEKAAMRLLEELVQRCILKVTARSVQGQIDTFRVHDLMRLFCIEKAKEHQFVGLVSGASRSRQPRRTAVLHRNDFPRGNNHLRTLLDFGGGEELPMGARKNLESIPKKFKLLRILSIWNLPYVALPNQIGNLIHLRYLSIEYTQILVLPESVRNLRNLVYLIYQTTNETDLAEVPDDLVGNMENLRGLTLPKSLKRGSLNRLGLSGPKNLQRLCSGAGALVAKDLLTLSNTVHSLSIYDIQNKEEMEALYQCPSIREGSLLQLWIFCSRRSSEEPLRFDLEKLRDCTTLESLYLVCQLARDVERTIIQFPPNLVRLDLYFSEIKEHDDVMQVLGQLPKLKHLSLNKRSFLGKQLSCTTSSFPQLQVLWLIDLKKLNEWRMEVGAMARLCKIWIHKCPKLKRLPKRISSITTLKELNITEMPEEFCRRIGYEGSTSEAKDFYIIQHIPSVIVNVLGLDLGSYS